MPRVRLKNSYKIHDPWWHFAHKFWVPNCCESRIMFSRTSVFTQKMLQVESGVLPAAVVAKSYAEVSANKHQVPLFQRMFQTQECGTYATSITRFRASNLETLTQLTWAHHKLLGLWLPPGTFRNWNLRSGEGSERYHPVASSSMPRCSTLPPRQPHLGCKAHTSSRAWQHIPHVHGKVIASYRFPHVIKGSTSDEVLI